MGKGGCGPRLPNEARAICEDGDTHDRYDPRDAPCASVFFVWAMREAARMVP